MNRAKAGTRFKGVYGHKSGQWRCVWYDNGKQKTEYFRTQELAIARSKEIQAMYAGEPITSSVDVGVGGTRAEWLTEIWLQIKACREITDPVTRVQALDSIARAYKAVRDDLAAVEAGAPAEDPASLSDEDLDKHIVQLRSVTGGTAA